MAHKEYKIGLDDREFKQKLRNLQKMTAHASEVMRRHLEIRAGGGSSGGRIYNAPFGTGDLYRRIAESQRKVREETTRTARATRDWADGVKSVARQASQASEPLSRLGDYLKGYIGYKGVKAFIGQLVQVRGSFQQLEIAFSTILKSGTKAQALLNQLADTAAKTPFDLQGVTQGAKQLLSYGTAAEDVNKKLLMLGDIASGLSLPLGDLVYLYGTTMTQGRVMTRDLLQFAGRGIPLAEELSKQLGVTRRELSGLVTAGKVTADVFDKAMESMRRNRFDNLMEKQSKSVTGQISNIQDAIQMMFNALGKQTEGVMNTTLKGISWAVENYKTLGKAIAVVVASYGAYRAALIANAAIEGVRTQGLLKYIQTLKLAQKAEAFLAAVRSVNPWVAVGTAVMGVITAVALFTDHTSRAEKAQKKMNGALEEEKKLLDERRQKAESLIEVVRSETSSQYQRARALEDLQALYPSVFKNLDIEAIKTTELIKLKKQLATAQDEASLAMKRARVKELQDQIKQQEKLVAGGATGAMGSYGTTLSMRAGAKIDDLKAELALAEKDLASTEKQMREASMTAEDRVRRAQAQLSALQMRKRRLEEGGVSLQERQELEDLEARITRAQSNLKTLQEKATPAKTKTELQQTTEQIIEVEKRIKGLRAGKIAPEDGETLVETLKSANDQLAKLKANYKTLTGVEYGVGGSSRTTRKKSADTSSDDLGERRRAFIEGVQRQAKQGADAIALDALEGLEAIEERHRQTLENISEQKKQFITEYGATEEQANALFYDLADQADKRLEREKKDYYSRLQETHATYLQARQAVEEKADKEAALFRAQGDEGNAVEVERKRDQDLKAIDLQFAMRSEEFESWANTVADMALGVLEQQLKDARTLLECLLPDGADMDKLATTRAKIIKLEEEVRSRQRGGAKRGLKEWQDLHRTLTDVGTAFRRLGDDAGGTLGGVIKEAGEFGQSVVQMVDGIITFAQTGIKGVQAASTAAQVAVKTAEAGTVVLAVISAILTVVQQIARWCSKNTELTKEQKEEYFSLVRSTNELAEANKRLMQSLAPDEIRDKYRRTVEVLKEGLQTSKKYLTELLDSGGRDGFLGIGRKDSVRQALVKRLSGYGKELDKALGYETTWAQWNTASWLDSITTEQIRNLKANGALWAKLGNDIQGVLENMLAAEDKMREIDEARAEALTATTRDRLTDDVLGFIDDLKDNMNAPAESFERHMKEAMKRVVRNTLLSKEMDAYYKRMAKAGEDGTFSESEVTDLKQMYLSIVEKARKQYEVQAKILGSVGEDQTEDPRSATAAALAQASQSSIDELTGLWYTTVQILDRADKRLGRLADLEGSRADLQAKGWQDVRAIRDLTARIEAHTGSMDTQMKDISTNGIRVK